MASILHALRSLLKFCRTTLQITALDPRQIRVPRIPRRDVVFLTKEEIAQLIDAVFPGEEHWRTVQLSRLCFRAVFEVLLGTGARISEILSLDRASVQFERREAKIIGVKDNGQPSGWDPSALLQVDHAKIVDRLSRYLGEPFAEFRIHSHEWKGKSAATIKIAGVPIPMVFTQPGTYDVGNGKQKTAFGRGTLYFRHGAKSETAHPRDLKVTIERELERVRKSWLGNIRRVVRAPNGAHVQILAPEVRESLSPSATAIRLVEDPRAPAYRKVDPDITHPHRQTELVKRVNDLMAGSRTVTAYDIQCVRQVHSVGKRADWYYKPKFGSPQYSEAFASWIAKQHSADPRFLDGCRRACARKTSS